MLHLTVESIFEMTGVLLEKIGQVSPIYSNVLVKFFRVYS